MLPPPSNASTTTTIVRPSCSIRRPGLSNKLPGWLASYSVCRLVCQLSETYRAGHRVEKAVKPAKAHRLSASAWRRSCFSPIR
jgi:hypothetical protein